MPVLFYRFRFAAVAAVSLALFVGGVVSGAAGSALILGEDNVAGGTGTGLSSSSSAQAALEVTQNGGAGGLAVTSQAGTGGSFLSSGGNAISGVARGKDAYGLYVLNTARQAGTGAAVRASADAGLAIFASSNGGPALFIAVPEGEAPLGVNSSRRVDRLNVDMTDGWNLGCPGNTVLSQGLCFGLTPRPAIPVWEAADTCQSIDAGGYRYRLPTAQQLRSARNVEGIDLAEDGEHADGIQVVDGELMTLVVFDDGAIALTPTTAPHEYRCVTDPYAVDVSVLPDDEAARYPDPAPASGTADRDGTAAP